MHQIARSLRVCGLLGVVALGSTGANADIVVQFTGMDLVYDGSSLYDAGSTSGGLADPADADSLVSVDFFSNGTLVGSLSSDISLDMFIPDITGIPDAPGTVYNLWTPGNPGFVDLLIGTSPLASEYLLLDIASSNITYLDASGFAQFIFGGTIGVSNAQNLPFGLQTGDPITFSFSSRIDPNSLTSSGGFITGFEASGTGEYSDIPAPASAALLALGAAAGLRRRR